MALFAEQVLDHAEEGDQLADEAVIAEEAAGLANMVSAALLAGTGGGAVAGVVGRRWRE